MTYADFTLDDVAKKLGFKPELKTLFPNLPALTVPSWLAQSLAGAPPVSSMNEKARSEFIVAPILVAARILSGNRLSIFSGQRFEVDAQLGLTGECDFIITASSPILPIRGPLLTILEAKRGDLELGLGQAIAQMVAAQKFNRLEGTEVGPVYGCVTTGELWQFLRITEKCLEQDTDRYHIGNAGSILAALLKIAELALKTDS